MHSFLLKSWTTVVAIVVVFGATASFALATTPLAVTSTGFDISYPQCASPLPSSPGFGVVGVNGGAVFTANQCLARELSWAEAAANQVPAFYANTGNPGPTGANWPTGQQTPRICRGANSVPCSYDFGWNAARVSFANAVNAESADGSTSPSADAVAAPWWLDVETGNQWETIDQGHSAANGANDLAMIAGAVASFTNIGVTSVGVYSTPSQWKAITGGSGSSFPPVPAWIPGFATLSSAEVGCGSGSFTGGRVAMIQYPSRGYDGDYVCGLLNTPVTTSVSVAGSSTFSDHLVSTNNDGTVTYVQTSGSPSLIVSPTGLVTTSGALPVGTYVATGTTSDTHGNDGTFSLTLVVGALLQNTPTSATVKVSGASAFTKQLGVTGNEGAVTYVQTSGSPSLIVSPTGLVTTSGALPVGTYVATGTTSDLFGDVGTFTFSLKVGALVQRAPTTASVTTTDSSIFSDQLDVGANLGAVTYVQTSGSAHLSVSPTGLVTTSGTLIKGTYRATGTTADPSGDVGTFTFALSVTPPNPTASVVEGHVVAGRAVTLAIHGTNFYGQPRITSHVGTTAVVIRDTGRVLIVRVTAQAHSRNGVFTFNITLADGQSCEVNYVQR